MLIRTDDTTVVYKLTAYLVVFSKTCVLYIIIIGNRAALDR